MDEVAGIIVSDLQLQGAKPGIQPYQIEILRDVFDATAELVSAAGINWIIMKKMTVLLQHRAAAGGVDHHEVGAVSFESFNIPAGKFLGQGSLAIVEVQSSAAGLSGRAADRHVVVLEHSNGCFVHRSE